tara:strand:+ start:428 stop:613 length:186 start_codon:yes stop_codon:yes gene_type:complete
MKKLIVMFASVALATSFIGCGGSAPVEEGPADGGDDVGMESEGEGGDLDAGGEGGDGGSEE